ncbi:ATP-grasp domain-containing protein [bacterium]|nr:ATP-grasp domain-containing protein [bacterium]
MRKLRVLIITQEDMVPPSLGDLGERGRERAEVTSVPRWKTEYDVATGLQELGHDVSFAGVTGDLAVLRDAIEERDPHICFNLLEEFNEVALYDQNIVSYLELLRRPYTGCNPRGLMLSHDKVLTKKLFAAYRIPTAPFFYAPTNRKPKPPRELRYPLVVKSATEHASRGISLASVVNTPEKCIERIEFIHESIGTDAIAEEYIEGREIYVSVLGNERLTVFPIWELDLSGLPEGSPRIATERVKFDAEYQEKHHAHSGKAEGLDPHLEKQIISVCKRAYRRLYLTGYARFDLRLRADGKFFLLEANANPSISYGDEFSEAAEASGVSYLKLLEKILRLGLSYRALWKE